MNIEEKRDKLQEYCDAVECCDYCRLLNFSIDCDFERFTDDCVCEAYKIAFYYNLAFDSEVKSDEIDNPVKHGKWLICTDGYYPYCSECGNEPTRGEMTKYCPECGARMDKE